MTAPGPLAPGRVSFDALATYLRSRPTSSPVRLIAVDGPGAAGKSTFAARLAAALGDAPVVHTDDIASHDCPLDWWPMLEAWVLRPLAEGRPGRLWRYDWDARRRTDWVEVPVAPVVVLEGVSSARRAVRDRLSGAIWIETGQAVRRRRAWVRDGPDLSDYWAEWIAAEDAFYADDPIADAADLVVDGAPDAGLDPEREFVLIRSGPSACQAAPG